MQPMPHPDSWFIDWLTAAKLVPPELIREAQARLERELAGADLEQELPTLGGLLERDGLLTREQREAGEREAESRRASFAQWRSQAIQQSLPRMPGDARP